MQRIESLTLSLTLRSCLAAALRRQRLSLHEEYEEFKQRVDGQAQLLIQLLSAELARLETDAAACAPATDAVTLPATAPKELPKDHADDDLPALQASSDSDEDTTEVMENGPPASTARDLGSPPSVIQQIGGFITIFSPLGLSSMLAF